MTTNGDASILIELDGDGGLQWPGSILSGRYRLAVSHPDEVRAVELSILWYTIGQGEEDMAVHYFQRRQMDEVIRPGEPPLDLCAGERFETRLPNSPLSYDGVVVKVRWCVRVRAFLARGKDLVAEREFRLGDVPSAQLVAT